MDFAVMKINLYYEGGIGDHLLAHRFAVGIKKKYPDYELHVYSDTENNLIQKQVLEYLYPNFYTSITVIASKKYKKCIINSQFCEEEYRGGLHNVPDDIKDKMIKDCDKFYSLHIDSLEFLNHDYDWLSCFNNFPKPEVSPPNLIGNYIVSHLISSTSPEHRLNTDFYLTRLVKDIDNFCREKKLYHIIISQNDTNHFYDESLKQTTNSTILNGNIKEVAEMIVNAKLMISIDSGFRPIAYP